MSAHSDLMHLGTGAVCGGVRRCSRAHIVSVRWCACTCAYVGCDRALEKQDPSAYRPPLKAAMLLTRDSRVVSHEDYIVHPMYSMQRR